MAPLLSTSLVGTISAPWARSGHEASRPRETGGRLIRRTVEFAAGHHPQGLILDAPRVAFEVARLYRPGASVADLGARSPLFAASCALLGLETWALAPLAGGSPAAGDATRAWQARLGVRLLQGDVRSFGAGFADGSLDAVAWTDGLAQSSHSPRPVLAEAFRLLKPGGTLLLGAPNGASLERRIAVAAGRSGGSRFEDWFYPDSFQGPVRAPVRRDLLRMVREIGFEKRAVYGRTWAGPHAGRMTRLGVSAADLLLRPLPTLASELYIEARKPV